MTLRPSAILIVALTFAACGGERSAHRALPRPSPLPKGVVEHARFRTLDGTDLMLQSVVGQGKVVVLNFWATWCQPCRMEIPTLTGISRKFRDKGVEIVGLSVEDPRDATDAVKMFATEYGIEYRLGFAPDETFDALSGANQPAVVPQTFVFDKSGKLTVHLRGLHPDFASMLEESIEAALEKSEAGD
jgi:thiol-disulfide isomerase/thioredoxin